MFRSVPLNSSRARVQSKRRQRTRACPIRTRTLARTHARSGQYDTRAWPAVAHVACARTYISFISSPLSILMMMHLLCARAPAPEFEPYITRTRALLFRSGGTCVTRVAGAVPFRRHASPATSWTMSTAEIDDAWHCAAVRMCDDVHKCVTPCYSNDPHPEH